MTDFIIGPEDRVNRAITSAFRTRKPSSKAALRMLIDLVVREADCEFGEELEYVKMSTRELIDLLAYFNPPTPNQPKNHWQFLSKAINTKEVRPYLHYVYRDSRVGLVASNGHVIHWVNTPEALNERRATYFTPSGIECPNVDYRFPDVHAFLGKTGLLDIDPDEEICIYDYPLERKGKNTNIIIHGLPYNLDYVNMAFTGFGSCVATVVKEVLYVRPKQGYHAAILPIRS